MNDFKDIYEINKDIYEINTVLNPIQGYLLHDQVQSHEIVELKDDSNSINASSIKSSNKELSGLIEHNQKSIVSDSEVNNDDIWNNESSPKARVNSNLLSGCNDYEADSLLYIYGDNVSYDEEHKKIYRESTFKTILDKSNYRWRYNRIENKLEFINLELARSNEKKLKIELSLISITSLMFFAMSLFIAFDLDALTSSPLSFLILFALSIAGGIPHGLYADKKLNNMCHLRQKLYNDYYNGQNDYSYQPVSNSIKILSHDEVEWNSRMFSIMADFFNSLLDCNREKLYNIYVPIVKHLYETGQEDKISFIFQWAHFPFGMSSYVREYSDDELLIMFPIERGIIDEVFGDNVEDPEIKHLLELNNQSITSRKEKDLDRTSEINGVTNANENSIILKNNHKEILNDYSVEKLIELDERLSIIQLIDKMPLSNTRREEFKRLVHILEECAGNIHGASNYANPIALDRDHEKFSEIVDASIPFLNGLASEVDEERYNTLLLLENKILEITDQSKNNDKDNIVDIIEADDHIDI